MSDGSEESDQLPEEHPEGEVAEDSSGGSTREDAKDNSGASGEKGGSKSATGNPANAGQD
jgi:hypothetical protein